MGQFVGEFPNLLIDNCASGGRRLDLKQPHAVLHFGEPITSMASLMLSVPHFRLEFLPAYSRNSHLQNRRIYFSFRSGSYYRFKLGSYRRNLNPFPQFRSGYGGLSKSCGLIFYAGMTFLTESLNNTGDDVWLAYQLQLSGTERWDCNGFQKRGNV
ncbi:MAG: hypothetical protein R2757_18060 [Draconibacterium sp.]